MTDADARALRALVGAIPGVPGTCVDCGSSRRVAVRANHGGLMLCADCLLWPDTPVAAVLDNLGFTQGEAAELLGIGRLPILRASLGRPVRRRAAEALHKMTGIPVADLMRGTTDMSVLSRRRPK